MSPFGFTPDEGDEENGKPEDLNAMMRQMQEQIQKQLGKQGFISYTKSDLQDVFEERETERMIYALESITEEQSPIEYTKDQVEDSYIMSEEIEFVKPDGQKTAGPVLKLCENTFNVKDKYTGKSFTYTSALPFMLWATQPLLSITSVMV